MADFATLNDLAIRLGRVTSGDLTTAQTAQGNMLLTIATDLIIDAVDRDRDWAAGLVEVPVVLRAVCLEVCARVMTNPAGVRSENEALGAHSHAVSYPDGAGALYLTDRERKLVRGAASVALSGSATLLSLADTIADALPTTLDGLLTESALERPVYDWAD